MDFTTAAKVSAVKDAAIALEEAITSLMAEPDARYIKVEVSVLDLSVIGVAFPIPRIQVQLQEIKNL